MHNFKIGSVAFIVILFLYLSGCASTPKIGYVSKFPKQEPKNVSIKISNFEDGRSASEKGKLGGKYNQYEMKIADILEPQDMISSFQQAFIAELENTGYATSNGNDLILKGTVQSVSCDLTNGAQTANIKMRLILNDKGREVLNSIYTGNCKISYTFDQTGSDAFNAAIRDLVASFVKDLNDYIKT